MLKFELIEENESKALYKYFPEGGSESGIVAIDKKSGECSIENLSSNDRHQRYAIKMFKRLREYFDSNSFDKSGMIAWS